jgi:hypothetical protein
VTPGSNAAWCALGAVAFAALLIACRGYTLGIPVADDYAFLARLMFHPPLDVLDSMGASYYWRPLSRQLYFSAIGRTLGAAPWSAALVNAVALGLTYLAVWRTARRGFSAPVATMIAVLPLLSEPARVLLAWPSGAQHLLAGMFAALAVHEALASRWRIAVIAAGAGMLSHESAILSLAAVPVVAAWRQGARAKFAERDTNGQRGLAHAVYGAALVLALWAWGYAAARAHGVLLPPIAPGTFPIVQLPEVLARALTAALNLEDLAAPARTLLLGGYGALAVAALLRLRAPATRAGRHRATLLAGAGALWFLLGVLPLTQLMPDWNGWRAWVPTLGLTIGGAAALACLHPALAAAFAGLKLTSLLLAPLALPNVPVATPLTTSQMSYVRLTRLQRALESTRQALQGGYPTLPHGSLVKYWNLPRVTEVGFQGSEAVRVWYRDSTLIWDRFGGVGSIHQKFGALIEYRDDAVDPAAAVERGVFEAFFAGGTAMIAGRVELADSLFAHSALSTRTRGPLYASLTFNRARIAIGRGDAAGADSLLRLALAVSQLPDADYWELRARIALLRHDTAGAGEAAQRCLALDPSHASGLAIARVVHELERRQLAGAAR